MNWGSSILYGLACGLNQCGSIALNNGYMGMYPMMENAFGFNYGNSLYCDLDQPSGLSSFIDNGYGINNYGYIGGGQYIGGYNPGGLTGIGFNYGGIGFTGICYF